jgi:hypothetical protein
MSTRVKAILDANRNSLMLLDLKFSVGTLGLAAGTAWASLCESPPRDPPSTAPP